MSESGRGSLWRQRRFVLAAAVVGLIALCGVLLLVTGRGSSSASRPPAAAGPPPASPTAPTTAAVTAGPTGSGCGLPPGEQAVPRDAPANTQWVLVGTMLAPAAPRTYGPSRATAEGIPTCYAHSPTGALFAAANFIAAATLRPEAEVLRALGADTPANQQAIRDAQSQGGGLFGQSPRVQLAGFRVLSTAPASATVQLALRSDSGSYISWIVPLVWQGDWKYLSPVTAAQVSALVQPVPDLAGFVPWGGG